MADYSPGLEGVIAGETAVSAITDEGLTYRGYPIASLVEKCTFEDVAYLLLYGDLPHPAQPPAQGFLARLAAARELDPGLAALVARIPPTALPMDAVRTAVSLQAHFDPETPNNSPAACLRKAERLIAQLPALLGTWHRARTGAAPVPHEAADTHAAHLLRQLLGAAPDAESTRVFDASLILYAEHEFNASTFAARVTVSTLSDLHSGVVSGIGALKGPLHGGANEHAMAMLKEVGGPDHAEAWIRERLAQGERIMGFGHRVVRQGDSRAILLRELGAARARRRGDTHWLETADAIQAVMARKKGLHPNLDFPCAWVYHTLGLPVELYTPIFVAARAAGWCAHIFEQLTNNRLIRPRGLYVGPAPRPLPDS